MYSNDIRFFFSNCLGEYRIGYFRSDVNIVHITDMRNAISER